MDTLRKIKSDETRVLALASVAGAAGEAGQTATALALVQEHRLAVAEALRFVERPGTLEQMKQDDQARKRFYDAHFFQRSVASTLSKIALSRADSGALQEALGYSLLIPEAELENGRTLGWLAFNQVKGGDVDGALRWITVAQLPSQKAFGLTGVASALISRNEKI